MAIMTRIILIMAVMTGIISIMVIFTGIVNFKDTTPEFIDILAIMHDSFLFLVNLVNLILLILQSKI